MSLREKLQSTNSSFNTHHHSLVEGGQDASGYSALKRQIHTQILDRINLEKLATLSDEQIKKQINELVSVIVDEQSIALNTAERGSLARDIQYEMFGLGPLEPLLSDPAISDILVNGYNQVYIERKGMLELTQVQFQDNQHLLNIIERIVSQVGRRVDESSPMVDARLADGSRVNAIIPPLALDGPVMSIRRFSVSPLLTDDLIKLKTMTPQMANLISAFSKSKMNAVIFGWYRQRQNHHAESGFRLYPQRRTYCHH